MINYQSHPWILLFRFGSCPVRWMQWRRILRGVDWFSCWLGLCTCCRQIHLDFTPHTPWLLLCTDSWSCSQEDCTGGQLHAGVVTQAVLCHAECRWSLNLKRKQPIIIYQSDMQWIDSQLKKYPWASTSPLSFPWFIHQSVSVWKC